MSGQVSQVARPPPQTHQQCQAGRPAPPAAGGVGGVV